MTDNHNPYATPKADLNLIEPSENGPWREDKILVVRRLPKGLAEPLPHRCLKCNQPGTPGKPKTYVWSNPALILLILLPFGLIILLILYFIYRKTIKMAPVLCEKHTRRRKTAMVIGWVGPILSIALMIIGGTAEPADLTFFGIGGLLLFGTLVAMSILNPAIRPAKFDDEFARFRECGPDFLNTLPTFRR